LRDGSLAAERHSPETLQAGAETPARRFGGKQTLDHDDFGLIQSKIMNVIDSNKIERDMQISLRNLRKLDCAGKPVPTFPHPGLGYA
jgi:hypothetical protein